MPKRRYISPEERQEIIDKLRLNYYNIGISKVKNENDKKYLKKDIYLQRKD